MGGTEKSFQRFSIELSDEGIAELDEGRRNVFVARPDISDVELRYGLGSERPLVVAALGSILFAVGLSPLIFLYQVLVYGGRFHVWMIAASAFLLLGFWLLRQAFQRRLYLLVSTSREARKLLLHPPIDANGLSELLSSAEHEHGYVIRNTLSATDLEKVLPPGSVGASSAEDESGL